MTSGHDSRHAAATNAAFVNDAVASWFDDAFRIYGEMVESQRRLAVALVQAGVSGLGLGARSAESAAPTPQPRASQVLEGQRPTEDQGASATGTHAAPRRTESSTPDTDGRIDQEPAGSHRDEADDASDEIDDPSDEIDDPSDEIDDASDQADESDDLSDEIDDVSDEADDETDVPEQRIGSDDGTAAEEPAQGAGARDTEDAEDDLDGSGEDDIVNAGIDVAADAEAEDAVVAEEVPEDMARPIVGTSRRKSSSVKSTNRTKASSGSGSVTAGTNGSSGRRRTPSSRG